MSSDFKQRMSRHSQISIGSGQKHISKLTEFPLACRALSQMDPASFTFGSPLEDNLPKPAMSAGPPKTPQLLKKPWGNLETLSTITSSLLAHTHPSDMSALPQRVRYLVGSKLCSMQLILDFEPSSPEQKTSTTGDLLQTSSNITAPQNKSATSRMPERTSKRDWQGLKKTLTSLPSVLARPAVQSSWPPFSTSQVFLMARSQMRGHLHIKETLTSNNNEVKVKGNLLSKQRVMSPTSSRYAFCQYLSPKIGHGGGPCDCMIRAGSR